MLLVFTHQSTNRLQYICTFIFKTLLNVDYSITNDELIFKNYNGVKINYSNLFFENSFYVKPHQILFEKDIVNQKIVCSQTQNYPIFFATNKADWSFDIFAASFYLISRYEEYLPHTKDKLGRYMPENSLAFQHNFLHVPLVNIWVNDFAKALKAYFPSLDFTIPTFNFQPTYDIDMAWAYKHKGWMRNIGGFVKAPSVKRLATLLWLCNDPFDCYTFLDDMHSKYQLKPIYFFLAAKKNGKFDKNILPTNKQMQTLIKVHASKYVIGIHPSYKSNEVAHLLNKEKDTVEKIIASPISLSRQHYIKLGLPQTYYNLIHVGITNDYSMGYPTSNGFRASVASPFLWYNLPEEKTTSLLIHPFCFMDATCFYHLHYNVEKSFEALINYYNVCKNVGGTFITIFHNSFLGTDNAFVGWRLLYQKFIESLPQTKTMNQL